MLPLDDLNSILCCPICICDLLLGAQRQQLVCPKCKTEYRIQADIPILLPPRNKANTNPEFRICSRDANPELKRSAKYEKPKNKLRGQLPYHLPAEIAALFYEGQQSWILDIGCGAGQNREFFQSRGYRYVGIDICPNGPDVVCDAHFLPFKSETFGAAVTFSTLEHLWNPFIAVSEAYRVLKKGAQFNGEAAFLEALHDNSYFHLSPVGLEACLQNAGFSVKNIWPGWGIGESIARYIFKQFHMSLLGRALGKTFDDIHAFTLIGSNLIRRIVRKPTRPITELLLSFAGSLNWTAVKPDSNETQKSKKPSFLRQESKSEL